MRSLYLECYSGISGDMTVGALLDLGADQKVLEKALASLPIQGFQTEVTRVKKSALDACDFLVKLDAEHENHDHNMNYLYGHHHGEEHHEHCHDHVHDDDHTHTHEHDDHDAHGEETHDHHHHHHEHRGMKEILAILEQADLSEGARRLAVKIFTILGEAEAKAHGTTLDQVHFHEVGAIDSIIDIVSVAVCFDNLGIEHVIVPFLCEGSGTVCCQHGILPIPVPAVANIATANRLRLRMTGAKGEYVTPTGAAIVAAVRTSEKLPETFVIEKIGLGAGKREQELPGILRAMILNDDEASADRCRNCKVSG
ncbi:LarC family nickel insertion protein [Brotaphodocola catenula]|uniref:LarC family nickel insertion protein n=1 Tax=Brotaphodocola catenula TaxID=2885361 RepID=UPI0027E52D5B|nr:LarC family nickel insertion protein [Brotaphodocola catenula]